MSENIFSQEAELAVISVLLNNPDAVYSVPNLRNFMFTSVYVDIFTVMQEIVQSSLIPEPTLVGAKLEEKGRLSAIGGNDYLKYICNQKYAKENLKEFERQVINNYKTRRLLSAFAEYHSKISGGEAPDVIISDFGHCLEDLVSMTGGEQVADMLATTTQLWKDILYRVEHPGIRGVTTGFGGIDLLAGGYNPGDLWVVAGRPGMGKSADMVNSALAVAKSGSPVLIFSLEMSKTSLAERMISILSEVPLGNIRLGTLSQEEMNKITKAISELKNLPIYIDTNFNTDETYFSMTTKKYHQLKGVRVVFFDYVQLASERGDNQTAEIGVFSRTAKLLANELEITVILYSQLNRGVELRPDKHPILSDLRQSGNLEEDADIVMFLYRDEYYNKENSKYKGQVEKMISKHRNGPTGSLWFELDVNTLRIHKK